MTRFIQTDPGQNTLTVSGDWVLDHIASIQQEASNKSAQTIRVDIDRMDTAGALLLFRFSEQLQARLEGLKEWQSSLIELVSRIEEPKQAEKQDEENLIHRFFTSIGKKSVAVSNDFLDLLRFMGEATIRLGLTIRHPSRLRATSLLRHIHETGVSAIPIVALIAFLISVVLAYQGSEQLRRFGAEIFTINMVAISVLREMGVLLTAIMIAGRSGSAFTAEIGVMKVNEEIDAMRIIGIRPFEFLVLPRIIALMITMPLLTFIADMMGILGGGIVSTTLLNISVDQYLTRLGDAIRVKDFWVGMIKAPIFGFAIAIVGCMRGMQVSGSAESVGRLTTVSVVESIFLVLLLDALFSLLFTQLGI